MRVMISGATGFIGSWMCEYLLSRGVDVVGTKRWRSPLDNVRHLLPKLSLFDCELTDYQSVLRLIKTVRPDKIFHLAAQSYVTESFYSPRSTLDTNINGTLNILEAVKSLMPEYDPIVHICSSSEVFGQVSKDELPITEKSPIRPMSPYAVSKVGEDMIAWQYFKSYGIKTIRTRQFTTTGPRRGEVFAESSLAKQVAEAEKDLTKSIKVGNMESVRTWLDVRDIVKAYWLLTERCTPGEVYIIKGDAVRTIGEVLDYYIVHSKRPDMKVEIDPNLLRPSDVTLQIPSDDKFRKATGWAPEISLDKTLLDLLNYWRQKSCV